MPGRRHVVRPPRKTTKRGRAYREAEPEDGARGIKQPLEAREIASRLRKYLADHFGTRYEAAVAKGTGIPGKAIYRWTSEDEKGLKTPATASLIALARGIGISPNWLLLGVGPEELGALMPRAELAEALRAHVVAGVRVAEHAIPAEVEEATPSGEVLLAANVLAGRSDFLRWRDADRARRHAALEVASGRMRQRVGPPIGSGGAPRRKALDWT